MKKISNTNKIPWVEKYRPCHLNEIVFDSINKQLFDNILKYEYFPNILLYGPPGTGKTTTIINLINAYQDKYSIRNKQLIIHLNASDERGIDIIRNQLYQFTNSKSFFISGPKFVILDEVDHMTKSAQHALKILIHKQTPNIRFCLMCNYISKIIVPLQYEFMKIRFNNTNSKDLSVFLNNINKLENIKYSKKKLQEIKDKFESDIRSMINYMQSNKNNSIFSINKQNLTELTNHLKDNSTPNSIKYIQSFCLRYKISPHNLFENYFLFLLYEYSDCINTSCLNFMEYICHSKEYKDYEIISYFVCFLKKFFSLSIS